MRLLAILTAFGLIITITGSPVLADGPAIVPVIPSRTPNWSAVAGVPGVHYAPNMHADIFRYQDGYYCQHKGRWYQGRSIGGPWAALQAPPAAFYRIEAPYFKVPPEWATGKKAGWRGAPMPPGQMKKYGRGPRHTPPGQAKKMTPLSY